MRIALFLLVILSSVLFCQPIPDPVRPPMPDSLFLKMRSPARDTARVMGSRVRVAAWTRPEAKAFINGKEVKVYSSGVFVGAVPAAGDVTNVHVAVFGQNGDSLMHDFIAVKPAPLKPMPHDTIVFDEQSMEPSQDVWLMPGEAIDVRFKGSPGWEASFSIPDVESGIAMRELPVTETSGVAGIYVGRYVTKPGDQTTASLIKFKLRKSFWTSEKAFSKGKISILSDGLPRIAEVIGKRPYFNAGLGSDRLGGAKLGFIQPGVQVQVTGKIGSQYRVRLSDEMVAWLPEEYAQLLPLDTPVPRSLAGSISAVGTDSVDIVTLSLSKKLPYTSEQLVNPNAILVNVFGATSNTNWITHHLSRKVVESVSWKQVAADHYQLLISLNIAMHWGYDIDYLGNTLRIKIRRPPVIKSIASPLAGLTIAVDPGHGGDNIGATGITGAREMDANFSMASHLETILKSKGARVVMTRTATEGPGMGERIDRILESRAQLLVSIHCNSGGDASDPLGARGVSTYYRHIGFKPLADTMYRRMLELGLKQFGVVGSFNFSLNAPTQLPNVLVETAFFSSPEDEILLLDDGFRTNVAEQITKGLEDFVRAYAVTM